MRLLYRAAFVLLLIFGTSSAMVAGGPSASGHGNLTIGGELRTFSFTAVTHRDGTVTGQGQLNNRQQGVKLHLTIDCLLVSGNTASVSGTVTSVSGPTAVQVGDRFIFRVVDNGEGSKAPPDTISLVFSFPPSVMIDCKVPFVVPLLPIDGGNIQVRP